MNDILCVNFEQGECVLEDGQVLPITTLFDSDGDECEPEHAVVFVAGPSRDGKWLSAECSSFERVTTQ